MLRTYNSSLYKPRCGFTNQMIKDSMRDAWYNFTFSKYHCTLIILVVAVACNRVDWSCSCIALLSPCLLNLSKWGALSSYVESIDLVGPTVCSVSLMLMELFSSFCWQPGGWLAKNEMKQRSASVTKESNVVLGYPNLFFF